MRFFVRFIILNFASLYLDFLPLVFFLYFFYFAIAFCCYLYIITLFLVFMFIQMPKFIVNNVDWHVNQFDLTIDNVCYFYSYQSLIAKLDKDKKTLKIYSSRDYSKTTRKHFYSRCHDNWLNELVDKKSVLNAIDKWLTAFGYCGQVQVNV